MSKHPFDGIKPPTEPTDPLPTVTTLALGEEGGKSKDQIVTLMLDEEG